MSHPSPTPDHIRQALATDRVIDITTTGRKSGTPHRIETWFYRADGRLFLTGSPEQVNAALKRIGQAVQEPQAHMDLIVAGNARTGLWKKMLGVAPAQQLVDLMVAVADDAGPAASSKSAARSP